MKRSIMAAMAAAAIGVSTLGASAVFAATDTDVRTPGFGNLVSAIATKFNIDEAEVQAVFDEEREQMIAEHEAQAIALLDQAVTDGKLTQSQADAIIAKQSEVQSFRESLKDMTEEERKVAIAAQREAMKAWIDEQGIPKHYLRGLNHGPMGNRGGGHHDGKFGWRGMHGAPEAAPDSNE